MSEEEKSHEKLARQAEDISMTAGIVSAAVGVGAIVAAPTGLSAIGVALGISSVPLIVTAAPIVGAVATVAGVVSGGAYFYSKWKNRQGSETENSLSHKQIKEIEILEQAHSQGFLSDEDFNEKVEKIIQARRLD